MSISTRSLRVGLAGVLAAAALGSSGAPALADSTDRCEGGETQLEQRFREIEEHRGYDAAVKWWDHAWSHFYAKCIAP